VVEKVVGKDQGITSQQKSKECWLSGGGAKAVEQGSGPGS
jgi:hypothetical protein